MLDFSFLIMACHKKQKKRILWSLDVWDKDNVGRGEGREGGWTEAREKERGFELVRMRKWEQEKQLPTFYWVN